MDNEIQLNEIKPDIHKFGDYDYCCFGIYPNKDANRVKKLFAELNLKHLNSEEQKETQTIC